MGIISCKDKQPFSLILMEAFVEFAADLTD
jgi:hypothetical protein